MKKKFWSWAAGGLLALLAICFFEPALDALPVDQSGWRGGRYYGVKGDRLTGWRQIDDRWYYLDPEASGKKTTGWLEQKDGRYYLDETGAMVTGWLELDTGTYYFRPDGTMATGWVTCAGTRYYLDEQGHPCAGWLEQGDGRYFLDETGAALTGWQEIDGNRYYFSPEGVMATGWIAAEDGLYYLTEEGTPYSGWLQDQYIDETGKLHTGWLDWNAERYYLNESGIKTTGWQQIGADWYYLNPDGTMVTGWLVLEGTEYYLHADGSAARGKETVEGETAYFSSRGARILLVNPWNPVPEDYSPDLVRCPTGGLVERSCAEALQQMMNDCREAGHYAFVCSSYRSIATQKALYSRKVYYYQALGNNAEEARRLAGQVVAVPGTSEHHTGLAVDIVDSGYQALNERQAEQPAQKWLMENSWRYGFILRYPNGTTESTGIVYEPWHYRYVGKELAAELYELGLCLEDYLEMLTEE